MHSTSPCNPFPSSTSIASLRFPPLQANCHDQNTNIKTVRVSRVAGVFTILLFLFFHYQSTLYCIRMHESEMHGERNPTKLSYVRLATLNQRSSIGSRTPGSEGIMGISIRGRNHRKAGLSGRDRSCLWDFMRGMDGRSGRKKASRICEEGATVPKSHLLGRSNIDIEKGRTLESRNGCSRSELKINILACK